jgi:hypothetical protein
MRVCALTASTHLLTFIHFHHVYVARLSNHRRGGGRQYPTTDSTKRVQTTRTQSTMQPGGTNHQHPSTPPPPHNTRATARGTRTIVAPAPKQVGRAGVGGGGLSVDETYDEDNVGTVDLLRGSASSHARTRGGFFRKAALAFERGDHAQVR